MTEFDGQRFRAIRNPESGTLRYEATPEYEAWLKQQIARAEADEMTVDRWIVGGMVGRLVRRNGGPVEIEPCDPAHDGELVIHEEAE